MQSTMLQHECSDKHLGRLLTKLWWITLNSSSVVRRWFRHQTEWDSKSQPFAEGWSLTIDVWGRAHLDLICVYVYVFYIYIYIYFFSFFGFRSALISLRCILIVFVIAYPYCQWVILNWQGRGFWSWLNTYLKFRAALELTLMFRSSKTSFCLTDLSLVVIFFCCPFRTFSFCSFVSYVDFC